MRLDDDRLKRALAGPALPVDPASMERDLHVVVQRGRRRRRNRRLLGAIVAAAILVSAIALGPRALDALRSVGEPLPATPPEPTGIITTVAGIGEAASSGDGGPATEAAIHYPGDLVLDAAGNLYIAQRSRIRKVDTSGIITTVVGRPVGNQTTPFTEANGLAPLGPVTALAIDGEGNLYIGGGDGDHFMVSRISPSGEVTRIAGTGEPGFSGDGGPAVDADLGWVYDLAVDGVGNVYMTDYDNHRIRMVDTSGIITTIAGSGQPGYSGDGGPAEDARLDRPNGIALDASGNVYFTAAPGVVRRIDTSGVITTIAGVGRPGYSGDGGPAARARLNAPEHVEVDGEGTVYIEDTGNHCIRMVDAEGIIQTIVGTCEPGFSGDGGPARSARLWQPSGMLLTSDGVLYVADSGNERVRRVIL
jgi:sugar lactone lactonase YvrE